MSFPNRYGQVTPLACVYKHESHKLHQAFTVALASGKPVEIISGDLVSIKTDGTVERYTGTSGQIYLGVAITSSVTPAYPNIEHTVTEVTVAVQGYLVLWAKAKNGAALGTTYVVPEGTKTDGYTNFKASLVPSTTTVAPSQWISITTAAADGDMIQVLCL